MYYFISDKLLCFFSCPELNMDFTDYSTLFRSDTHLLETKLDLQTDLDNIFKGAF